ncbi:MAG TPA: heme-copper oxidase subunit III [Ktedonobacteraceae bacterium]|nr:heme-copper oxidase subunit III [Ktedonobacteraceae bacterium]
MSVAHGEHVGTGEEHGQGERSINWWGMIFFIASEALIFANFIAAYLYLEIRNGNWLLPTDLTYPLINTFILLASSLPAHYLVGKGIARGNQRNLKLGLFLTALMGIIFLGGQVYEYSGLFGQNFTLSSTIFGSSFFMLTGFHGLHVTIGVLFLVICLLRALRGDFTARKHFAIQAVEMYWHFVDGVWVVVFSLVYLLPHIR